MRLLPVMGLLLALTATCAAQTPLNELTTGQYQGFPGGLYAASNEPPPAQATAARSALAQVVPRDATGAPEPMGSIGLISIGMSNTSQEFRWFERLEDANPLRHASLVFINGAIGSHPSEFWADPQHQAWSTAEARVAAAGLSPSQVQVAWIKLARGSVPDLRFPQHAMQLRDDLRAVVRNAKVRFPNLRVAWLSSRIWGGWSSNPQRNEPLSYETAFAVRWLIEDQVAGDPLLSPVEAPVLLWGPYLWAAGASPRADGLDWPLSDFEPDAIHPNDAGERKAAALLSQFFNTDAIAAPWYRGSSASRLLRFEVNADATVDQAQPSINFGAQSALRLNGAAGAIARSYLRFDVQTLDRVPSHALVRGLLGSTVQPLLRQTSDAWSESTLTFSTAPGPSGAELGTLASFGDSFVLSVGSALAQPQAMLNLVMFTPSTSPGVLRSRESGDGPYLLVRVASDSIFTSGFE
ncbi:MAG: hypothetical protein ACK5PG_11610 [Lysobacterales bacterium]|jgi:hypothetical protein